MRFKRFDWWAGFIVGIAAPLFSLAIALDSYPVLKTVGDVTNPAWKIIAMRAVTFGVMINAILFFAAINTNRERIAKGVLVSCIPSILAVFYFQFILK